MILGFASFEHRNDFSQLRSECLLKRSYIRRGGGGVNSRSSYPVQQLI